MYHRNLRSLGIGIAFVATLLAMFALFQAKEEALIEQHSAEIALMSGTCSNSHSAAAGSSVTTFYFLSQLGADEDSSLSMAICVSKALASGLEQVERKEGRITYGDITDIYPNVLHFCSKSQ